MVSKKKNVRRTPRKKKNRGNGSKFGKIAFLVVIGAVSVFGLWQFWGSDEGSVLAPVEKKKAKRKTVKKRAVDVGKNKKVDPTLLNETVLLAEDAPKNKEPIKIKHTQEVKEDKSQKEVKEEEPSEVEEASKQKITIKTAGEEIVDTDISKEEVEKFPLYAVAYHFHTQILAEPKKGATPIGYARRGNTFRVSLRVSTRDCKKGWHELSGGGFICDGVGVKVSTKPVTFSPAPPQPDINKALPYKYKYAKEDNTAEYWRIPTVAEIEETKNIFTKLSDNDPTDEKHDKEALAAVIEKAGQIAAQTDNDTKKNRNLEIKAAAVLGKADGGVQAESESEPVELPAYVHLRMAKGYYVSVDDVVEAETEKYQQTVRGRYIPHKKLYDAKPSEFRGVLLNSKNKLPLVFVAGGGVSSLKQDKPQGPFSVFKKVKKYSRFALLEEVKRQNRRYLKIGDNQFVSSKVARVAKVSTPPKDLEPEERWIDINLTEQTLVAYEGESPVFATLVSTGRKDFETPEGEFRIYGKHISITMDDPNGGEEAYSIEDVPWTQYFKEGYALHTAFWHNRFGRVRSHGCVNLSPADARRLFFWTGPHLSDGFHGIISTEGNPGTRVVIHK